MDVCPIRCISALLTLLTCLLSSCKPVLGDAEPDNQIVVPRRNLSCHECYRNVEGEECVTFRDPTRFTVRRCDVDELFCVVEKYRADGELTTFSRKCARACQPGCKEAGRGYKVEYCYHCCQQSLCNNMSLSTGDRNAVTLYLMIGCLVRWMVTYLTG